MAILLTATDAKAQLLALLDRVAEGEEIEITKHGRPVARLVPAVGSKSIRSRFVGVAVTAVNEGDLFSTGQHWDAE